MFFSVSLRDDTVLDVINDRHIIEANEESKRQLSYAEERLEDLKIGLRKKSTDVLRDRLLLNSALDDLENDSTSSTPPVSG